jgi:hypothetical protein
MVTNKALTELKCWANAAHAGQGDVARQHLQQFIHVGMGFTDSKEFRQRYEQINGRVFDAGDFERTWRVLDTIANIEVCQVETSGVADDRSPIGAGASD